MDATTIRMYHRLIRELGTMPSDILPNQLSAAESAHLVLVSERNRRITYKARYRRRMYNGKGKGGKGVSK